MAHNETVFTPSYIVELMLDEIGYTPNGINGGIRHKHIIDNSCGDGAFLREIVKRYIEQSIDDGYDETKTIVENNQILKKELETYIHGIEIQPNFVGLTKEALNRVVEEFIDLKAIGEINWDIRCADALDIKSFDGKMDYVVGNPPYCNVHHFGLKYDKYKSYNFMQRGMSDLYLLFFELGFKMLKPDGKLAYITPDSWFTSIAGNSLRNYILSGQIKLNKIIQCGHETVFPGVTTFSAIVFFDNKINGKDEFFKWKTLKDYIKEYWDCNNENILWHKININEAVIGGKLYLGEYDDLCFLRKILNYDRKSKILVKNGFATLKDKLFTNVMWLLGWLPPEMIFAIKASTGERKLMFYPYDKDGNPKKWDEFRPETQERLLSRAKELEIDTTKDGWYLYGRTQGINDFNRHKIAIKSLLKGDINKVESSVLSTIIQEAPAGNGVYGGLYITPSEDYENEKGFDVISFNTIVVAALLSEMFPRYVKLLGHHKNGGYYTFTSKELEKYLNFCSSLMS